MTLPRALITVVVATLCSESALAQTIAPANYGAPPPPPYPSNPAAYGGYAFPTPASPASPVPPAQPAPPATRFGDQGQIAISAGSPFLVNGYTYSNSDAKGFNISFEPSFDYFLIRNVSVGVGIDVLHTSTRQYSGGELFQDGQTLYGADLHAGLNVPFSKSWSLYPRFFVGFQHRTSTSRGVEPQEFPESSTSFTGPWIRLEAPLLYHPVEHLFVGLGPFVYHDFASADDGTTVFEHITEVGGRFVLGGYFSPRQLGETDRGASPAGVPSVETPRRFGDAGTVVLTQDTGFDFSSNMYPGSVSSGANLSLSAGLDWFFTRRVSLGFAAFYSRSKAASSTGFTSVDENLAVRARWGGAIPLNGFLSLYPRLGFTYGVATLRQDEEYSASHMLSASLEVPLLFHLATHFFMGLGPVITQDIVNSTPIGAQNRRTFYGAFSELGGWL